MSSAAPLDTRIHIETPESIDLLVRPAGLVVRSLAYSIDLGIRAVAMGLLLWLLSPTGNAGIGLSALLFFMINWWYMVLFEMFDQGRSPGKRVMGLRVVQDDGTPVSWGGSLIRNLLRFVDMLPFGYAAGAVCCLQHPSFKRLGDLAGGTLVVYHDHPPERPRLPDAAPLLLRVPLTLDEQRAVLAFAERQQSLSNARAKEVAGIAAQALRLPPGAAVAQLNGLARGLLGGI